MPGADIGIRAKRKDAISARIRFRPGTVGDELATFGVMSRAAQNESHWDHHSAERHHLRMSSGATFWVAEDPPRFGFPRVVGYARSVIRESVWSLTELFVLPEYHQHGIGGELLRRCLEAGKRAGARIRFVLASQSFAANALYIREAGCFPRIPIFLLAGPSAYLRPPDSGALILEQSALRSGTYSSLAAQRPQNVLAAEPLRLTPELQAELNDLDRTYIGFARPQEHAFWSAQTGVANGSARVYRRLPAGRAGAAHDAQGGRVEGYAYVGANFSGPALARDPANLPGMIAHALRIYTERVHERFDANDNPDHFLSVPGTNTDMLEWLLTSGWKIIFSYYFMSSEPFGQFQNYVCHNPLYFL